MDLYESILIVRQENDELRQENLRLRNELGYAMRTLATLKHIGISSIDVSLKDIKDISENPPTVDIRNYVMSNGDNVIEW